MLSTIMCTATMAASAVVAESTAQAAAGVATGFTSATSSSSSCSLNGVLSKGGTCRCDAPWSGPSCGQLAVKPVDQDKNPGAAIYGWAPNVSSWGGSILQDESSGKYHLFAAEIPGGLIGWGSHSECIHATADVVSGPFTKQDVVLHSECHGPVVIRDPKGEYLMFHIGDGGKQSNTSAFMHHSASPSGPWIPAKTTPGPCGMPNGAYHPNGTLFLVCQNGHSLYRADHWDGTWQSSVPVLGPPSGWEDPSLWFDARGNWHIMYHVYATEPFSKHHELYSGHAYSTDGLHWTFSTNDNAPFTGTVLFDDATSKTFATRERPQMIFDASKDPKRTMPIGMTSAVSPQPLGPWCDQCAEGACSQCKITKGRDWTYTIYQGLGP